MDVIKDFLKQCSKDEVRAVQEMVDDRTFELGINKYSTGKAYNFVREDNGDVSYRGSTIQPLDKRKCGHHPPGF